MKRCGSHGLNTFYNKLYIKNIKVITKTYKNILERLLGETFSERKNLRDIIQTKRGELMDLGIDIYSESMEDQIKKHENKIPFKNPIYKNFEISKNEG